MKVKKLEKKLNNLNEHYEFIVKPATSLESSVKGDLAVSIRNRDSSDQKWTLMFYLMPPHESVIHGGIDCWTIDVKSNIDCWTPKGLKFYIKALKVAEKFLNSKEK